MRVWPGNSYPLGPHGMAKGEFCLVLRACHRGRLCLFDTVDADKETHRIPLTEHTDQVWHAYLPEVLRTTLRLSCPWSLYSRAGDTASIQTRSCYDPYARSIGRDVRWADELFGYHVGDPEADLSCDERDNAAYAPLAVVIDTAYTWGRPPTAHTMAQNHYCELHVKVLPVTPRCPRKTAWYVRWAGVRGCYPAPGSSWHYGG